MWEQKDLKEHAVYQIYPISFCDGNGDGKGDLLGIISKLDYLKNLGIHLVWLSPIYESPMVDMGYDISDYYKINPLFGTMEDFELLIAEAKKRDIRIIMDLVVNHTSDRHAWFQEALKNPNSKYRDYYYFQKGRSEKEYPNNWTSNFTGPAWEAVPNEPGMYYLHIFSKEQPDLNWHNKAVLKEVENIMTFWMDKGAYGFRCDVISEIYKTTLEDGKKQDLITPVGSEHYIDQPGNHDILKQIHKDVVEPRGGILIGECFGVTSKNANRFLEGELDTLFEFDIALLNRRFNQDHVNPKKFKECIVRWQQDFDWNGNYLENHDQHRSIGRYVYGKDEKQGAKMLLTLIYTLRGTPFIYMGQEFGTKDYSPKLKYDQLHDCSAFAIHKITRKYCIPDFISMQVIHHFARDDCRAPMAFDGSEGHGFSKPGVTPWQIYNPRSKEINAKSQEKDPSSILNYFIQVNRLREQENVLSYGSIFFLESDPDVLWYKREEKGRIVYVLLNLSRKKRYLPTIDFSKQTILLSNYTNRDKILRPYEAIVYEEKQSS